MDRPQGKCILVMSSHVVRGSVGNRAIVFSLERMGHIVWSLPTIILAHHPGHGVVNPLVPDSGSFQAVINDLLALADLGKIDGILTGYFASRDHIEAAGRLVAAVKEARPDAIYLCDPVIGDSTGPDTGALYVGVSIAEAVRDVLLPIADIATPNRYECNWLATGGHDPIAGTPADEARLLAPDSVIVTSHEGLMRDHIGNLLVSETRSVLVEHLQVSSPAKGSGDIFAGIYLARLLAGNSPTRALELASSSVFELMAAASKMGSDELPLSSAQQAIVKPHALVNTRILKSDRGKQ